MFQKPGFPFRFEGFCDAGHGVERGVGLEVFNDGKVGVGFRVVGVDASSDGLVKRS